MRVAYQRALRLNARDGFLQFHQDEWVSLETLPGWMTRLFGHLIRLSNFQQGHGEASFAQLHKLMDKVIQPRSGPRLYVPDVQALKKAVRAFEERGLLARDKAHSQAEQKLFFVVRPRVASVRPNGKLEPQTRTPVDSRKGQQRQQVSQGAHGELEPQTRTPYSTGIQDQIARGELSTDSALKPPEASTPPGPIRVDREGGTTGPQGGRTKPALWRARPPVKTHQAPQGAEQTPPGDAEQLQAELAEVRARMQAFERGGGPKLRQEPTPEHGKDATEDP